MSTPLTKWIVESCSAKKSNIVTDIHFVLIENEIDFSEQVEILDTLSAKQARAFMDILEKIHHSNYN